MIITNVVSQNSARIGFKKGSKFYSLKVWCSRRVFFQTFSSFTSSQVVYSFRILTKCTSIELCSGLIWVGLQGAVFFSVCQKEDKLSRIVCISMRAGLKKRQSFRLKKGQSLHLQCPLCKLPSARTTPLKRGSLWPWEKRGRQKGTNLESEQNCGILGYASSVEKGAVLALVALSSLKGSFSKNCSLNQKLSPIQDDRMI